MSDWQPIATAPRDGRTIRVAVKGGDGLGFPFHELPFRVRYLDGRWCYARKNQPVFEWHQPVRWREDDAAEVESLAA